jgi:hypothetical protein
MIPANLKAFFKKFLPTAPDADSVVSAFKGDPNGAQEGIEADLDIQYIMGVAPGILTEFWEQKSSDFCKDLIAWTALYVVLGVFVPPLLLLVSCLRSKCTSLPHMLF